MFAFDWLSIQGSQHISVSDDKRNRVEFLITSLYFSRPPGVFHFQPTNVERLAVVGRKVEDGPGKEIEKATGR